MRTFKVGTAVPGEFGAYRVHTPWPNTRRRCVFKHLTRVTRLFFYSIFTTREITFVFGDSKTTCNILQTSSSHPHICCAARRRGDKTFFFFKHAKRPRPGSRPSKRQWFLYRLFDGGGGGSSSRRFRPPIRLSCRRCRRRYRRRSHARFREIRDRPPYCFFVPYVRACVRMCMYT